MTVSSFAAIAPRMLPQMHDLRLEEKVGQMMLVNFEGESTNRQAQQLICENKVGGIVYFNENNGLTSPEQVKALSKSLQELSELNRPSIPLLIGLDQEGGLVTRLKEGFAVFPGNRALAMTQDVQLAEQSGKAMGQEMRAVGINLNLAPVVDINNNPKNPVIGIRSFGKRPDLVSRFGLAALKGFQSAGIIATLKHFPGHGDVEVDSHEDLPVLAKSQNQIENFELRPFFELAHRAEAVMTAHLMVPSIDSKKCCTLSRPCLDLLRQKKFSGIIISDCLTMKGVLKNIPSVQEAALEAIDAGCDVILLAKGNANQMRAIQSHLVDAIRSGRLDESRIDRSVARIFHLKNRFLPSAVVSPSVELNEIVNTPTHRELALQIAKKALKVEKRPSDLSYFPLSEKSCGLIALKMNQVSIERSPFLKLGESRQFHYIEDFEPTVDEVQRAIELGIEKDVAVILTYNLWRYRGQLELLLKLRLLQKPLIHISLSDKEDLSFSKNAELSICTFGPTLPSIQAVAEYLFNHC